MSERRKKSKLRNPKRSELKKIDVTFKKSVTDCEIHFFYCGLILPAIWIFYGLSVNYSIM